MATEDKRSEEFIKLLKEIRNSNLKHKETLKEFINSIINLSDGEKELLILEIDFTNRS
jgi:hypothetical protein